MKTGLPSDSSSCGTPRATSGRVGRSAGADESSEGKSDGSPVFRPSVVFLGSGPVAAKCLERLIKNFEVEAVVTKQKPAHHRGDFPVINLAEKLGLKVLLANTKTELNEVFAAKPVTSKLGVVIDYGVIVSQAVIDYFPLGIINSHFSLLPEWRGADPITFSILSGQKMTGVSVMLISAGLDEGPLLALGEQPISEDDTTGTLTDKLILLSDALLKDALPKYISGESKGVSQEEVARLLGKPFSVTHSRKIKKEDGVLDFNKSAVELEREVRAYSEWPKSRTRLGEVDVIVTSARVMAHDGNDLGRKVGTIIISEDGTLSIQTSEGLFLIEKLKPAGKKDMSARDFLLGYGSRIKS